MKFNASTLVEVIIAMIITSIVFLLSLLIVLNISKNNLLLNQYESYNIAYEVLNQLDIDNVSLSSEEIEYENFIVEKTVSEYNGDNSIMLIVVEVKDYSGKIKSSLKRLIKKSSL